MAEGILMTIFCVFAVYGAVRLVFYLYGYFASVKSLERVKRHTVLFFENSQEDAEVAVRELVMGRNPFCGEIIAVDKGSLDDTMPVLRRLEKEYEFLHVMNMEDYISFIKE